MITSGIREDGCRDQFTQSGSPVSLAGIRQKFHSRYLFDDFLPFPSKFTICSHIRILRVQLFRNLLVQGLNFMQKTRKCLHHDRSCFGLIDVSFKISHFFYGVWMLMEVIRENAMELCHEYRQTMTQKG